MHKKKLQTNVLFSFFFMFEGYYAPNGENKHQ